MSQILIQHDEAETQPLTSSIAVAVLLPILFSVVYWGTGWLSADAEAVSLAMAWEDRIPLLGWMIIPYFSLNLVFLLGAFLCETRQQLLILVGRLLLVLAIAAAVFLTFPTTTSYSASPVTWELRAVYEWLDMIDVRNNAFPSLHVAMAVVLWVQLATSVSRSTRPLVHTWLAFVVASTVLTHRHHVLDAVAGAALGLLAIGLIRSRRRADASAAAVRSAPAGGGAHA